MALPGQLRCQLPGRLRRPSQRRHRGAPLVGLDQREQRRPQPRIKVHGLLPAPTKTTDPPQQSLTKIQFSRSARDRVLPDPCRGSDAPAPSMPQRQRFRPYDQPTLTLVQMRQQHLELRSQDGLDPLRSRHTRTSSHTAESHDLIPGKP